MRGEWHCFKSALPGFVYTLARSMCPGVFNLTKVGYSISQKWSKMQPHDENRVAHQKSKLEGLYETRTRHHSICSRALCEGRTPRLASELRAQLMHHNEGAQAEIAPLQQYSPHTLKRTLLHPVAGNAGAVIWPAEPRLSAARPRPGVFGEGGAGYLFVPILRLRVVAQLTAAAAGTDTSRSILPTWQHGLSWPYCPCCRRRHDLQPPHDLPHGGPGLGAERASEHSFYCMCVLQGFVLQRPRAGSGCARAYCG